MTTSTTQQTDVPKKTRKPNRTKEEIAEAKAAVEARKLERAHKKSATDAAIEEKKQELAKKKAANDAVKAKKQQDILELSQSQCDVRKEFEAISRKVLSMPYYKNAAASSGSVHGNARHENAIKDVFIAGGLTEMSRGSYKSDEFRQWINDPSTSPMPIGSFIEQPCGTHDSPDFIVRISATCIIGVEAKSAKSKTPLYNSGGIKPTFLYIFCSDKTDSTTMFWGRDLISDEQQAIIDELIQAQRELERIANKRLRETDTNNRGISYYTRPMIGQSGAADKTDYFNHKERAQCEQNVLDYFTK
jgi:hypothetical protein